MKEEIEQQNIEAEDAQEALEIQLEQLQGALADMEVSDDDDVHPGDDGDDYGNFKHPKVLDLIEKQLPLLDKEELIFLRKVCSNIIKNTPKKHTPLCPKCETTRLYKSRLDIGMCVPCEKKQSTQTNFAKVD